MALVVEGWFSIAMSSDDRCSQLQRNMQKSVGPFWPFVVNVLDDQQGGVQSSR